MRTREIVLGNLRLGDAFWALRDCLDHTWNHVFCVPYNLPAVEAAQELTGLRIDQVTVVRGEKANIPERRGPADYAAWVYEFYRPTLGAYPCLYRWSRRPGGQYGDCRPYPLRRPRTPRGGIVVQFASGLSRWKRWAPLREAVEQCGRPVLVADEAELSYTELGHALLEADAFVGIASSVAALAMLLGVPSIVCWWTMPIRLLAGEPEWHTVGDQIVQLAMPTADQIGVALSKLLTAGECRKVA